MIMVVITASILLPPIIINTIKTTVRLVDAGRQYVTDASWLDGSYSKVDFRQPSSKARDFFMWLSIVVDSVYRCELSLYFYHTSIIVLISRHEAGLVLYLYYVNRPT